MIAGAGSSGSIILKELLSSRLTEGKVFCFVDDDVNKVGKYLMGVPIAGGRKNIPELVKNMKLMKSILPCLPLLQNSEKRLLRSAERRIAESKFFLESTKCSMVRSAWQGFERWRLKTFWGGSPSR